MRRTNAGLLVAVVAVLVSQAASGTVQAQQGPAKGRQQPGKVIEKLNKQETKLKEAMLLKEAWVLMAMGNANYAGHRAKAMNAIEDAVEILDRSILHFGTGNQKMLARQNELQLAFAEFQRKHQGQVREAQALSNLQLAKALEILLAVRPALEANKQPRVLTHVDRAIKQLRLALS